MPRTARSARRSGAASAGKRLGARRTRARTEWRFASTTSLESRRDRLVDAPRIEAMHCSRDMPRALILHRKPIRWCRRSAPGTNQPAANNKKGNAQCCGTFVSTYGRCRRGAVRTGTGRRRCRRLSQQADQGRGAVCRRRRHRHRRACGVRSACRAPSVKPSSSTTGRARAARSRRAGGECAAGRLHADHGRPVGLAAGQCHALSAPEISSARAALRRSPFSAPPARSC